MDASQPPRRPDVRVLGPVEVDLPGVGAPPDAELAELVVLLAVHPEGLAPEDVPASMWPGREAEAGSRAARVLLDRARAWLGPGGTALLEDPVVRLVPAPVVDGDLLREAVSAGRTAEALPLLRGPVLEGRAPGRYPWAAAAGLEHGLSALVVDACSRLARHLRRAGDPAGARAAAQAGLRVVPREQRLWRELLRAEQAAGAYGRVAELGGELAALLARALPPYDRVSLETRALLAELRRHRPAG